MPTIKMTAADNELLLVAYNVNGSWPLARVTSGYNAEVNVTLNLQKGQYSGQTNIQNLKASSDVFLPAGNYRLVGIGINWGGPANFAVSFDDKALAFEDTTSKNSPGDNSVAVKVTQPYLFSIA